MRRRLVGSETGKVLAKTKKTVFFTMICFLLANTLNCSSAKNENVNKTNSTTQNPSNLNTTSIIFYSGGIGLDQKDWKQTYGFGMPTRTSGQEYDYQRNDECLTVQYSTTNRIIGIYRHWGCIPFGFEGISTSAAQKESEKFIPTDAKIKTRKSSTDGVFNNTKTVCYGSESLKSRFSESDFPEGRSGFITIVYSNQKVMTNQLRTTSYRIALGCE
jgi:hypothetical protein